MENKTFLTQPETVGSAYSTYPLPPYPSMKDIAKKERGPVAIYGIYCWMLDYMEYRDVILEIGYKNIRTAGPVVEEAMAAMMEDGLDIMMTLGQRRNLYDSDEAFLQGNIDDCLKLLGRFGPNGSYFQEHPDFPYRPLMAVEVYNEPNFGYMLPNATPIEEKVALYTKLQVALYDAVKPLYPDVTIVGFGAGGASAADIGFIFRCFDKDPRMAETMDVFATHPYVDPRPPFSYVDWLPEHSIASAHKKLRALLDGCGKKDMPIWYTELGWFIPPSLGGHFNTCQNGNTLLEHAAYNAQVYLLGLRLGVERITTMYIMDTDNCNPGIVNRDGSKRPAAYAVKHLIDILPDPKLLDAIHDGRDYESFAYRFESKPDGEEVVVVFTANRPKTITIPWDAPKARLTDMMGCDKIVDVEGGNLTLEAGIYPLYVRHI